MFVFEGLKEGKAACCGSGAYRGLLTCGTVNTSSGERDYELCSNPGENVWFDGGHTTDAANRLFAELFWIGSTNITQPYNVKQLFELT